jgi:transcription-repair coupling factor (superfamily II helicase)
VGSGIGAPRIRDLELAGAVAGLLLALDGRPPTDVDITNFEQWRGTGSRDEQK